jgi:heme-degrading monooxygenase HmoA
LIKHTWYALLFAELAQSAIAVANKGGCKPMIARVWKGWTTAEHADAYERLLNEQVIPGLRQISGYQGAYILRNDGPEEAEFVVVNFFDSLEAVQAFAGPDYAVPVFEPEARQLLSKVEPIARHYEVKLTP